MSVLIHAAFILALLYPAMRFARANDPGNPLFAPGGGGGGGGGGGEPVAYISLPAFTPPPPLVEEVVVPPVETPVVPEVAEPVPVTDSVPDSVVTIAKAGDPGTTPGTGAPGSGGGTGGGVGPGTGPGTGPGRGPGSGGGTGFAQQPRPKQLVITPDDPPRELRGQTIQVMFLIKPDGRVDRVEFTPEIRNREYADKLRERLLDYTFVPARSASGVAIAVQYPIEITF